MRLKEHGAVQLVLYGEDCWIESLEMTRLQDAAALFCQRQERVCLRHCCGDGLLHQHIQPRLEQLRGDGMMVHGRNGDRGRVQLQVRSQQRIHRSKDWNSVLLRSLFRAGRVGLNRSRQSHACTARFQLAIDAKVIAAKGSRSGDGDTDRGLAGCAQTPLPSTALRQRL